MSNDWTEEEVDAVVTAYMQMLSLQNSGRRFRKVDFYRRLQAAPLRRRTEASIKRKMENITAVLRDGDEDPVHGYSPSTHVQHLLRERVSRAVSERSIVESDAGQTAYMAELDRRVGQLLARGPQPRPEGRHIVRQVRAGAIIYERDHRVVVFILQQADGRCERCGELAPFHRADGRPYLEVRHVLPLTEGGPDVVENTVAVCPNCHRLLHFGADVARERESLYEGYGSSGRLKRF